jgi:hypothetical protein
MDQFSLSVAEEPGGVGLSLPASSWMRWLQVTKSQQINIAVNGLVVGVDWTSSHSQ